MARPTRRPSSATLPAAPDEGGLRAESRRTWTLILAILGLLALALGLKAWDERQTAERAFLSQLDAEAQMLAARVAARTDGVQVVLRLVGQEDLSTSEVAAISPNIDALVPLHDAGQSPPGSRLGDAAAAARTLAPGQSGIVLTGHGDFVFVSSVPDQPILIALSPVRGSFAEPKSARLTLRAPDAAFSFGNSRLA
ncbi:MAG: hypothetical protein B7Z22_14550, partial [Hyphomonas sp. 32-62-5]